MKPAVGTRVLELTDVRKCDSFEGSLIGESRSRALVHDREFVASKTNGNEAEILLHPGDLQFSKNSKRAETSHSDSAQPNLNIIRSRSPRINRNPVNLLKIFNLF